MKVREVRRRGKADVWYANGGVDVDVDVVETTSWKVHVVRFGESVLRDQ